MITVKLQRGICDKAYMVAVMIKTHRYLKYGTPNIEDDTLVT